MLNGYLIAHLFEFPNPRSPLLLVLTQKLPVSIRSIHFNAKLFPRGFAPRFMLKIAEMQTAEPRDGIIISRIVTICDNAIALQFEPAIFPSFHEATLFEHPALLHNVQL